MVGCRLVLNYMQTLVTHYFLECSGQAACMEIHSYWFVESIVFMCEVVFGEPYIEVGFFSKK